MVTSSTFGRSPSSARSGKRGGGPCEQLAATIASSTAATTALRPWADADATRIARDVRSARSARLPERLEIGDRLRHVAREHAAAGRRDEHVVLDADADAAPARVD